MAFMNPFVKSSWNKLVMPQIRGSFFFLLLDKSVTTENLCHDRIPLSHAQSIVVQAPRPGMSRVQDLL